MTDRQINKVKWDPTKGRTLIQFDVERDGGECDSFVLDCFDKPHPALLSAIDALASHVAEWCEAEPSFAEGIQVRGVSFSWTDGIMGATITALKSLRECNSPLVLNTPHKPSEPYSETAPADVCLKPETIDALLRVLRETEAYIDGKREQGSLFGAAPDSAKEAA